MAASAEDILTMQVARFLKIAAPDLLFFHVPNGGYRHPAEAKKLKDMGVMPGVPDMAFILPGGLIGFIELKTPTGRVSPDQKTFATACIERGAAYALCRSLEAVSETLTQWGVKLRARPTK